MLRRRGCGFVYLSIYICSGVLPVAYSLPSLVGGEVVSVTNQGVVKQGRMSAIGEAFLSSSVQFLFEKLAAEVGKVYGVRGELASLQGTLTRLRAMLRDAEEKKIQGESFTLWLRELKNAARDAEDVVEEFEYEALRRKVQRGISGEGGTSVGASKSLISTLRKVCKLCPCLSPHEVLFRHEMANKISDIRKKLELISKDNKELAVVGGVTSNVGIMSTQPESNRQIKETTSLLVDPIVFGRANERDRLIGLLLGKSTEGASSSLSTLLHPTPADPSVLSIIGMGGLGKTTLAQMVYNSKEIQEHFHIKIWVHVSPDFDPKRVTKQILEHILVDAQTRLQSIDSLNVLQHSLVEKLEGKCFLVVLDDVWEEDRGKWQRFYAPLTHGETGSRVLITTRSAKVADAVLSVKIQLEVLSFDDSWSIFKRHAFPNGNPANYPQLEPIGRQIVDKLRGIPLAVTTIGGVLRCELEERKWRNVLENELWKSELQGGEDIFPILKLSYEYLPPYLKQCFAYCSVYPKGAGFDVLELVQSWMAQGYILPHGNRTVEEVGWDYFNELLSRSLLQFINGGYVIHDLLHDLGRLILQHDSCEINLFQSQEIPRDADFRSHLVLFCENALTRDLEVLYRFNRLRTLVLVEFSWWYFREVSQAPLDFLGMVKCLRVLDLRYCGVESLPDSIENLTHLRYLNLTGTPIKSLPESLCALYMLQTLKLGECYLLNTLPKGMSNLISLRHLEARLDLISTITRIGKLIHLQNLKEFYISEENGNKIGDLKDMNELRGKLCIRNLHEVRNREDAFRATLKDKQHLEILDLEWADRRFVNQIDNKHEESIIEVLQPPPHLKVLIVKSFAGVKFPSWMNNSSISRLEYFHLHNCMNLTSLPSFEQLGFLKTLDIILCPKITELPHLPTRLTNLILGGVNLNKLPDNLYDLPLEQLTIFLIPDLKSLPLLPATLKQLTIEGVGLEALPEFHSTSTSEAGDEHESSANRKPVLSILQIHGCPHLTTLTQGPLKYHLRHLRVLSIKDCMELTHWPEGEAFRVTIYSLVEELSIEDCPKLKALPDRSELSPSLKKLVLTDSPGVPTASLFNQLQKLQSCDVQVEMEYPNLASCSDKALCHIMVADSLKIEYLEEGEELGVSDEEEEAAQALPISLVYATVQEWSKDRMDYYVVRQMSLTIQGKGGSPQPVVDDDGSATVDNISFKLLCMSLGGHPWTASLQILKLYAILGDEASFDDVPQLYHPLRLPSLRYLRIKRCKDMTMLPTEKLLYHLTSLTKMTINRCPRLTMLSVVKGIRTVPTLKKLSIYNCPTLSTLSLPPLLLNASGSEDATSSAPPSQPLPPPRPLLQDLNIDDPKILTLLQVDCHTNTSKVGGTLFCDHVLTSLTCLRILDTDITSFMAAEEKGLGALASCLQYMELMHCPNLQNLPVGFGSLLPNLKALHMYGCPEIRCLPDELPGSLELLQIMGCPMLAKRCRPRQHGAPPPIRGAELDGDWHKIANVPIIIIDGVFLRGMYSKYLELKAKQNIYF